jgi:hypothetical protein
VADTPSFHPSRYRSKAWLSYLLFNDLEGPVRAMLVAATRIVLLIFSRSSWSAACQSHATIPLLQE